MTDYALESVLRELLLGTPIEETDLCPGNGGDSEITDLCTYEEGGYLTYDRGLVFRTADGSEFQLTIRKTR